MYRHLAVAIALALITGGYARAEAPIITRSQDATSADIPLTFVLEKTLWNGRDIRVWGSVKNSSGTAYDGVQVILTALDSKGSFIGRHSWFADPELIGQGQVGYIENKFVDCEGREPTTITFAVTGRAQ